MNNQNINDLRGLDTLGRFSVISYEVQSTLIIPTLDTTANSLYSQLSLYRHYTKIRYTVNPHYINTRYNSKFVIQSTIIMPTLYKIRYTVNPHYIDTRYNGKFVIQSTLIISTLDTTANSLYSQPSLYRHYIQNSLYSHPHYTDTRYNGKFVIKSTLIIPTLDTTKFVIQTTLIIPTLYTTTKFVIQSTLIISTLDTTANSLYCQPSLYRHYIQNSLYSQPSLYRHSIQRQIRYTVNHHYTDTRYNDKIRYTVNPHYTDTIYNDKFVIQSTLIISTLDTTANSLYSQPSLYRYSIQRQIRYADNLTST